jgi:hypothetical protein
VAPRTQVLNLTQHPNGASGEPVTPEFRIIQARYQVVLAIDENRPARNTSNLRQLDASPMHKGAVTPLDLLVPVGLAADFRSLVNQ